MRLVWRVRVLLSREKFLTMWVLITWATADTQTMYLQENHNPFQVTKTLNSQACCPCNRSSFRPSGGRNWRRWRWCWTTCTTPFKLQGVLQGRIIWIGGLALIFQVAPEKIGYHVHDNRSQGTAIKGSQPVFRAAFRERGANMMFLPDRHPAFRKLLLQVIPFLFFCCGFGSGLKPESLNAQGYR